MKTRFGPFTLDRGTRQLMEGSREVHLAPKAFELLALLLEQRPSVVSKASLQEWLWPGSFVVEANVSNLVSEIREALSDRARAPRFIRTAHGFGYAFCAEAVEVRSPPRKGANQLICWLDWGGQRFPLSTGEHVIGRDPDVEVRLDRSTISRRHARLVVTADRVVIEDFGSKNGTFLGDEPVTSRVALTDGDAIRLGSLLVTFHVRSRTTTTETQDRTR